MTTPPQIAATCRKSAALRPACPAELPDASWDHRKGWSHARPLLLDGGRVFDVAVGAEHLGHPEQDRPPRFVHLVIASGTATVLALARPSAGARVVPVRDGLRRRQSLHSIALGRRAWSGTHGELYLASPRASLLAHHLVYEWSRGGRSYAVSLHAWEPFTETVATLRRIVASSGAG